jgi:hypothetical protein
MASAAVVVAAADATAVAAAADGISIVQAGQPRQYCSNGGRRTLEDGQLASVIDRRRQAAGQWRRTSRHSAPGFRALDEHMLLHRCGDCVDRQQ